MRAVLTFKDVIISFSNKHSNIPIFRSEIIASYRKKNAAIRHEYYTLSTAHDDLSKFMLTFTAGGRGRGVYTKLRLINEIKSYITYLIANSNAKMYFFSNIEIGHSFSNPHIHTQIWCNDKSSVISLYEKVIKKFSLVKKRCSLCEPHHSHNKYNYVIKDYHKDLSDDYIWNLEQTKKRMRKTLGLQLRFYSRSKSKYQKALYRILYRSYGVLRAMADDWLDFILPLFFNKEAFLSVPISSFISIKNKEFLDLFSNLFFICFYFTIDILFYSPSHDPPFFLLGKYGLRFLCVYDDMC